MAGRDVLSIRSSSTTYPGLQFAKIPSMRATYLAFALVVGAASVQAAMPSQERETPGTASDTASLEGTVVVNTDGHQSPVRRARVVVTADSGSESTDTDTEGRFHLDHLLPGTYKVVVKKSGFVPAGRTTELDLRPNSCGVASIQMVRGAAVEGRLTAEDGEPVIGFTVTAGRLGYGPYGRFIVATEQATTDDRGQFRVHTLPAGDYYIEAGPDPMRMMQVLSLQGPVPKPARTYFDAAAVGTPRLNEARVITLGVGQQATGLDFSVVSSAVATLTVRVVSTAGTSPAGKIVRVQRVGAPPGEVRCLLSPNGPATCPNVPPGDFWVLAGARVAPSQPAEYAATKVTIEGRDQNLILTTSTGTPVHGRVVTDGAPLRPNAHIEVVAHDTAYQLPAPAIGEPLAEPTAPVLGDAFTFKGLFGPRLLRVLELPDGWAVKSVKLGDADITDTPTVFTDVSALVTLVVTQQTGSVAGTVADAAGQPAVGSRVVVFSADERTWGARSRYVASAEAGLGGRYALHGLLPGKYFVAAVNDLPDGAWEDPDRLAQLQTVAAAVTVNIGATTAVDWKPR